jgi:hypothetical protein
MSDLCSLTLDELLERFQRCQPFDVSSLQEEVTRRFAVLTAENAEYETTIRTLSDIAVGVRGDPLLVLPGRYQEEVVRLACRVGVLEAALRKYGAHSAECRIYNPFVCTCGLTAALASVPAQEGDGDEC